MHEQLEYILDYYDVEIYNNNGIYIMDLVKVDMGLPPNTISSTNLKLTIELAYNYVFEQVNGIKEV